MGSLILNADDYGWNRATDEAVDRLAGLGTLSSTTVMVNMPCAEDVIGLQRAHPHLGIGVHLTLTQGEPVSPRSEVPTLIGDDGDFLPLDELTRRLRRQKRIYPIHCVGWKYYDGNFPLFEPDEPLTAESMQYAVRRIMRWFYGPRHVLAVGMAILSLPTVVFWLHRRRDGWRRWSRRWWTSVHRAGGWLLLRKWIAALRKDGFLSRLAEARKNCAPASGHESYSD